MAVILRQRRDTAANWAASNPVIPDGQLCFDTTNNTFRIGNGVSTYSALAIQSGTPGADGADGSDGADGDMTATGSDGVVSRWMSRDCGLVFVDKGNSGTTTQTLDYTAGSHQKITATGNHTIATSNWPPSGNLGEMLLELTNGAAYTLTWPTINWVKSDGTVTTSFASNGVTLQSSGTDFIVLWSRDAGTTIYGKVIR